MNETSFADTFRHYVGLLWHWAWLLVIASLLAGGTAYLTSIRVTPVYQASTLVMINEAPSTMVIDYNAVMTSELLASTYAKVMTTRPVLERVIEKLGLSLGVSDLQGAIEVTPVRETQLIRVVVEGTDPDLAALIANTLVAEFAEQNIADQALRFTASKEKLEDQLAQLDGQIQQTRKALSRIEEGNTDPAEHDRLEALLAQYLQTYSYLLQAYEDVRLTEAQSSATVLHKEPAVAPVSPVRPRTETNTLLGTVTGLILSIGIIFLIEALDDTLHDPGQLEGQLSLPVIGLIARHKNGRPIAIAQPRSPVTEAFRALRTNLQFAGLNRPLRTLLVTSPSPRDGKSTVAVNLSVVLAQSGLSVLLIDADLHCPQVHHLLGLDNQEGLSSLFLQLRKINPLKFNLEDVLQLTETPGLMVLTTGRPPSNPAELLGSENIQHILDQTGTDYDLLVIDSPPVLAVTDTAVLATNVDGVVLVVKPGETKLAACHQAVEHLRRVGANLFGVVLSDVDLKGSRYYYTYKNYYAAYGKQNGE